MHDLILTYQEKRQRKQNWAESEYKITWSYKLEVIFELEDISFISYFHKEVKTSRPLPRREDIKVKVSDTSSYLALSGEEMEGFTCGWDWGPNMHWAMPQEWVKFPLTKSWKQSSVILLLLILSSSLSFPLCFSLLPFSQAVHFPSPFASYLRVSQNFSRACLVWGRRLFSVVVYNNSKASTVSACHVALSVCSQLFGIYRRKQVDYLAYISVQ